ncbi:MAG TPA: hypothetical protein VGK38_02930 [Prolixibacteraceae bacterium]
MSNVSVIFGTETIHKVYRNITQTPKLEVWKYNKNNWQMGVLNQHYVKMVAETGTEPDSFQTRIKPLPNPTELLDTIILNRGCNIV